jgi:hypothetical protein
MKRIFSLILAAVMILAAVPALGEDPDPIVGVWYGDIKVTDPPQLPDLEGMTHGVILFVMEKDGKIWGGELDFMQDGTMNGYAGLNVCGSWKSTDSGYITSIIGAGEVPAYIHDGMLYVQAMQGIYYGLPRMTEMNIYPDSVNAALIQYRGW